MGQRWVASPTGVTAGVQRNIGMYWRPGHDSNVRPLASEASALSAELPGRAVGAPGLEPGTFALSGQRSNQLSYAPEA